MSELKFDSRAAENLVKLYTTPDVIAQRGRALEVLKLEPGQTVADIGCGPGFLAQSMVDLVGSDGRVEALDISSDLIEFARAQENAGRIKYHVGDATNLPFKDQAFDITVSTQVLEYVGDVDRAVAELARITKIGGRVLVVDTDWDATVWRSSDPALMARMLKAWEDHCPHPRLPRGLIPRLKGVGLDDISVEVYAIINTDFADDTYSYGMAQLISRFVTARELIKDGDAARWRADLRTQGKNGTYFFSNNRYIFEAVRRT